MKNFRSILISVFCFIIFSNATAQTDFPKYKEAVSNYFESNDISNFNNPDFHFQKKPEGWFVEITYSDTIKSVKQIWDSKTKKYSNDKLSEKEVNKKSGDLISSYVDNWEQIHYDACPYYGYNGWDKDIIKDFGSYDGSDTLKLYGIGRAYSFYADNLLSDRTRMADSSLMFKFKNISENLTPEQYAVYANYRNKGIEYYRKVKNLNPKFQTLVGDIGLKCDNEVMAMYLDLLMYSDYSTASKVLTPDLFTGFVLEFGYNLLMSCNNNAIMFVYGDLDTFVPMYLQAVKGIRRDVTIINAGMLGLPRYVNYLRQKTGLKMTLDKDIIAENELEYIYVKDNSDHERWTTDKLFKYLSKKSNKIYSGGLSYASLPVNAFEVSVKGGDIMWKYSSRYIYKYDLLIADIFSTNLSERDVYFSSTSSSDIYEVFIDYMVKEGIVYHLTSDIHLAKNLNMDIAIDKTYKNIFEIYKWDKADEAVRQEKLITINYRMTLQELAVVLAGKGKNDSAMKILNFCLLHFGNDKLYFNEVNYQIVEAYYIMGKVNEGNKVAETICLNVRQNNLTIDPEVILTRSKADANTKLKSLRELMNKYGQADEYLKYN